ncbi:MAG: hypothetical protein ACYDAD_01105 [Acidimicrobiales bacterium]
MTVRICRLLRRPTIALLLTVALVVAGCSAGAKSAGPSAASATSSVAGDYVYAGLNLFAAVSTNGQNFVAYVCDGDPLHKPTFAEWFKGRVTGTHIMLTNADGVNLDMYLHPWIANAQLTFKDGSQAWFLGAPVTSPNDSAKLIRSEQTIGGVQYLAGWVDPGTIIDEDYSVSGYKASMRINGTPVPAELAAARNWCEVTCMGGAIRNEQTGTIIASPMIHEQDVASGRITVPDVGTFNIIVCHRGKCT